jgi:hypothetical protein
VAVGVHEPPFSFDLLDAEESRRFGFRRLVAAIAAIGEIAFAEPLLLDGPRGLQLFEAGYLARPVVAHPLPELVYQRFGFEQGVAGILVRQMDRADFERRRADRVGHDYADLADGFQLAGRAAEVDEHHRARFVVYAGQIVARVRRLRQKGERDGGADPGSGDRGQAHRTDAAGIVDAQVEALRRTQAQFQHQELEGTPIGGQAPSEVFQRPGNLRAGALEHGAPGFTRGGSGRGEKREQHPDPIALH